MDDPAPAPMPASNCSQGGLRVLEANDDIGEHQARNELLPATPTMGTGTRTGRKGRQGGERQRDDKDDG
jgi:hypothetical protein